VTDHDPKARFTLTLEGKRDNPNAHVHTLKFILKHLLRSRSLKCVDAREINTDEEKP
jgi:hypothetical protein